MGYLIDKNAKNVWVRDHADTEDLSVIPNASSVYFNNGRTMEQEFGKGTMVSNVVTVDSSMEKVVEGTYDGAYESCKMYGKSLVNLMTNCKDEYVVRYHNPSDPNHTVANISMMKPNTEYTLFYKAKYRTKGDGSGTSDSLKIATYIEQGFNIYTAQSFTTEYKQYVYSFTTSSVVDCFVFSSTDKYFAIKECVLLEGDYTDQGIPYFEGLCDVKMPILKTVGKNLFPPLTEYDNITKNVTGSEYELTENKMIWNSEKIYTPSIGYYFNLKPNTKYTFSCSKEGNPEVIIFDRHSIDWDSNHSICTMSTIETTIDGRKVCNFITRSDGKVCIRLSNATGYTVGCWIENCCLTEASISNAHVYEDYKTNILETSNDVVLRGLPNGVKDSYDCLTGEYVQRVSGITLDGTQSVSMEGTLAYIHIADLVENNVSMSDALPSVRVNDVLEGVEGVAVQNRGNNSRIDININGLTTAEEITQRLQQKPVTIQYQLAEPIVTTIEPSTTPFAYENGHIILESGYEGQSLLPTLEYQTVVSRSGQVAMIDKTIQQHERKITLLEKMLVQNIIDIEYKNTLLALKLEIDEVI